MKVYIASLSDYNNGRLEGKWFDLSDYLSASDLMDDINDMLKDLTKKYKKIDGEVREEWAVHDYEGIPPTLASEYMGEADFQKLMDIREIAEDRDIPVEVLVERAGDTGSDDYEALADSLVMVVDGSDETDIVYELESQTEDFGYDFWKDYIYISETDKRILYGEDVDQFRERILDENPDMDEDEAESQAEEMADEEESRRNNDLIGYLEDMGYQDEFPNYVMKDYNDAWKYALSYDYDVIHHDDQMYVFTNNYSVGGTILSGLVGAYIGYKIGRSKPQKKGFETEKKIGRKIKGALSKKKYAGGGKTPIQFKGFTINYLRGEYRADSYGNPQFTDKNLAKLKQKINIYLKDKYARGGNVNTGRSWHLDRARHNKRESYEIPMGNRKRKYEDGGQIGQEIVFDDNGEENTGVIKDITNLGDYVVKSDDGRTLLAQRDLDVISLGAMRSASVEAPRKRFGFFSEGGGVEGERTYSVYELRFGQPYNFYNEEQNKFIPDEPTKATLYTKAEAENKREELRKPRRDYYQRTGNNYTEIHIGNLYEKGILKYSEGGGVSGLDDLIRG
jgi:antirestriction protein